MNLSTMLQEHQSISFGAHRGASAYCPENTMAAYRKAVELQADLIELDVQLSKDGQVMVFHNHILDGKTDGTGFVWDYTLAELKQLDAGSWFSGDFAGERIPTLEEVLAFAHNQIFLSIELKQLESNQDPLARKVVQLVQTYQMEHQVQIMSFNHRLLTEVRRDNRTIMTSVICGCRLADPIHYLKSLDAQILNSPWYYLSPELIATLHDEGFYVCGSMTDDISIMQLLYEWRVDLMDTNIPDEMRKKRQKLMKLPQK
ncbi:MAG: glycerophosphoryl diester phosphodiesterase family protein [Bacilli bacterium]|nr:glycerophosphoryl diester phosphodiesterase family protein [Bacilli bacterium]